VGLGAALDGLKRYMEAASSYEKALQIEPANAGTWNRRGASLFAGGAIEQALWCFDRALVEDSRFAMARFNKATAEETLGRRAEAARSFQQFLNVAPPNLKTQIERARARLAELRSS
jgi:tetratricopeptide (TPR) repeat protein